MRNFLRLILVLGLILHPCLMPNAFGQGCDSNTQLLLHVDGADEDTSTTDENCDGSGAHTVTMYGMAQLDDSTKKFGTTCLVFPALNDRISIPDSSDWDIVGSNSDNWTIDCWVYAGAAYSATQNHFISQYESGGGNYNMWRFWYDGNTGALKFDVLSSDSYIIKMSGGSLPASQWNHVALSKVADEYGLYINGTQTAYLQDSSTDTFSGSLFIGIRGDLAGEFINGRMDEIRIQKSNYFNASPNSTPDDSLTVPTEAYSVATATNGQLIIIQTSFLKREGSGYDRVITKHWYTHKDVRRRT